MSHAPMQESLASFRQQADHTYTSTALGIIGDIELARENVEQKRSSIKRRSPSTQKWNKKALAKPLLRLAKLFQKRGQTEHVARIFSVTEIWQSLHLQFCGMNITRW